MTYIDDAKRVRGGKVCSILVSRNFNVKAHNMFLIEMRSGYVGDKSLAEVSPPCGG